MCCECVEAGDGSVLIFSCVKEAECVAEVVEHACDEEYGEDECACFEEDFFGGGFLVQMHLPSCACFPLVQHCIFVFVFSIFSGGVRSRLFPPSHLFLLSVPSQHSAMGLLLGVCAFVSSSLSHASGIPSPSPSFWSSPPLQISHWSGAPSPSLSVPTCAVPWRRQLDFCAWSLPVGTLFSRLLSCAPPLVLAL